jgi:hypothetical protein
LLPLVYEELRKLAAARMAQESPGQTLQPTALVHEAWLRLVGEANPKFDGRAHFFGAAAEAMRRILIENARHEMKRPNAVRPTPKSRAAHIAWIHVGSQCIEPLVNVVLVLSPTICGTRLLESPSQFATGDLDAPTVPREIRAQ